MGRPNHPNCRCTWHAVPNIGLTHEQRIALQREYADAAMIDINMLCGCNVCGRRLITDGAPNGEHRVIRYNQEHIHAGRSEAFCEECAFIRGLL